MAEPMREVGPTDRDGGGDDMPVESREEEEADHNVEEDGDNNNNREPSRASSTRSQNSVKKAKPHRGPPSPTLEELEAKEKEFILDCIAIDRISKDYSQAQPKLGPAINPYNSQRDKHVKSYFGMKGVDSTLEKTEQADGGCSIDGPVIDRFIESGAGYRYLHTRNESPRAGKAGHSKDQVDGHGQFMSDAKPNFGYHGHYGYRRNTPWLRNKPSPFGTDPRSPLH